MRSFLALYGTMGIAAYALSRYTIKPEIVIVSLVLLFFVSMASIVLVSVWRDDQSRKE